MLENLSLSEKFRDTAVKNSSGIVIQFKKDNKWAEISYDGLKNNIESLSAFLREQGVESGDRVAILLENRSEWP